MGLPPRNIEYYVDGKKDNSLIYLRTRVQANKKGVSDAVADAAAKAARGAAETMRIYAPKTGAGGRPATNKLRESIRVVEGPNGPEVLRSPGGSGGGVGFTSKVSVGAGVPYARYVFEGTGLYGPKKARIYPRNAKAMSFPAGYIGDKSDNRYEQKRGVGEANKRRASVNIFDPLKANQATQSKKSIYYNNAIAYSTRGQKPNKDFFEKGESRARREIRDRLRNLKAFNQ